MYPLLLSHQQTHNQMHTLTFIWHWHSTLNITEYLWSSCKLTDVFFLKLFTYICLAPTLHPYLRSLNLLESHHESTTHPQGSSLPATKWATCVYVWYVCVCVIACVTWELRMIKTHALTQTNRENCCPRLMLSLSEIKCGKSPVEKEFSLKATFLFRLFKENRWPLN